MADISAPMTFIFFKNTLIGKFLSKGYFLASGLASPLPSLFPSPLVGAFSVTRTTLHFLCAGAEDVVGTSSQIFSTLYAQAEEFPNKAGAIANKIEKQIDFN